MVHVTQSAVLAVRETPETAADPDTRSGRLERLAELAQYALEEYCSRLSARRCEAAGQARMQVEDEAP